MAGREFTDAFFNDDELDRRFGDDDTPNIEPAPNYALQTYTGQTCTGETCEVAAMLGDFAARVKAERAGRGRGRGRGRGSPPPPQGPPPPPGSPSPPQGPPPPQPPQGPPPQDNALFNIGRNNALEDERTGTEYLQTRGLIVGGSIFSKIPKSLKQKKRAIIKGVTINSRAGSGNVYETLEDAQYILSKRDKDSALFRKIYGTDLRDAEKVLQKL